MAQNNAIMIVIGIVLLLVLWFAYSCYFKQENFNGQMSYDTSNPALSRSGEHRGAGSPIVERPAPVTMVPTGSPLEGVPAPMSVKQEMQPAFMEEVAMSEVNMNRQSLMAPSDIVDTVQRMNPGKIPIDGPGYKCNKPSQIPPDYYFLDDGANGEQSQINNICSPSCCNTGNWPSGIAAKEDPYVMANRDKFVGTNQYCKGDYSSGCMCLTKKQARHVLTRGGNGLGLF